jgi:hypothetical protein
LAIQGDFAFILPNLDGPGRKAYRKLFNRNPRSFGNDKVAQLMHEDENTQNDYKGNNGQDI